MCFGVQISCKDTNRVDQKVVKIDGIEYKAAQSVSDNGFKRAQFVVEQMTARSHIIREQLVTIGFMVEVIGRDQVLTIYHAMLILKGRRRRIDVISIRGQGAWVAGRVAQWVRRISYACGVNFIGRRIFSFTSLPIA